jgi:hypothetical protein
MVDGSRCCAFGWSAGGANVVYLVSRPPTLPHDGQLTSIQACDVSKRLHLPPLRAIIPTYPVVDLEEFNAPFSDFEKLCDTQPVVASAKQEVDSQSCSVAFRMESRSYAA